MEGCIVIAKEERSIEDLVLVQRIAGYVSQENDTSVIHIVLWQECFPTLKTVEDWVNMLDSLFSLVIKPVVRFDVETVIITMRVHQLTRHWVIEGLNRFMKQKEAS